MAATSGTRIVPDANIHDSASRLLSWSIALPSIDRGLDSGTAGGLWELEPTITKLQRDHVHVAPVQAALSGGGCCSRQSNKEERDSQLHTLKL